MACTYSRYLRIQNNNPQNYSSHAWKSDPILCGITPRHFTGGLQLASGNNGKSKAHFSTLFRAVGCERVCACACDRWMQQFRDVFTHALIDRLIKIEIEKCIARARVFVWGNNKGNHFAEYSRLVNRGVAFWLNFGHMICALGFVFFFGS